MENVAEALKLAFAVLLLTLALGLTLALFSQARSTSDIILSAVDETKYYEYTGYEVSSDATGNRIVGMETVIPTLYKYSKERYKVVFKSADYDASSKTLSNIQPLRIYTTTSNPDNWYKNANDNSKNYQNDYDGSGKSTSIYTFDIDEEIQRNEPWTGSTEQIKLHLDALFSGGVYTLPQTGATIDYSNSVNGGGILNDRSCKFIEQISIVENSTEDTDSSTTGNKTTKKRIITYIKIN